MAMEQQQRSFMTFGNLSSKPQEVGAQGQLELQLALPNYARGDPILYSQDFREPIFSEDPQAYR